MCLAARGSYQSKHWRAGCDDCTGLHQPLGHHGLVGRAQGALFQLQLRRLALGGGRALCRSECLCRESCVVVILFGSRPVLYQLRDPLGSRFSLSPLG